MSGVGGRGVLRRSCWLQEEVSNIDQIITGRKIHFYRQKFLGVVLGWCDWLRGKSSTPGLLPC